MVWTGFEPGTPEFGAWYANPYAMQVCRKKKCRDVALDRKVLCEK